MKRFSYTPKIRWKTLTLVSTITLLIHLYALYLFKDYSFSFLSFTTPTQAHISEDSLDLYSKSIKKRNQDLEHIFTKLSAKSIAPSDVKFNFHDLDKSSIPTKLTSIDTKPTPLNEYPLHNEDFNFSFDEATQFEQSSILNSLAFIEKNLETSFEPNSLYYLEQNIFANESSDQSANIFKHSSLIDIFDGESFTASLNNFTPIIKLNEPTLPSSENDSVQTTPSETARIIANSSDFLVDVEYAPQLNRTGFIFKIALKPKPYKQFKRIKQNFFFLIDRSHSIPQKYYQAAKDAVAEVLHYLHDDDTFNILIFDDKVTKFSSKNLSCSEKNIALAELFLKTQKHGGIFATTDLYSSLDKIIPEEIKDDEINTAILLSDGDTYINKQKKRKTLNYWTQKNKGKISLFCLAIGKVQNIALLDLLSIFNKGFLRAAFSDEAIKGQLVNLVQSIRSPIGKDLIVTGLPHNRSAKLNIYPSHERLPNLYENLEYILYGSLDQASDFTLFLQGRYYDQWLDIKKSISLSKATLSDGAQLKKGILLQEAYQEYEQYLRSGHPEFLENAKSLLEPVKIPVAFD